MSAPKQPGPAPWTVRIAAVVVAAEGVGALVAGGWIDVGSLRERPTDLGLAVSSGVLLLVLGAGLLLVAWNLFHGRRWTRGPTVATQLLALLMAYDLLSGPSRVPALVVGLVCLATLALMFLPASTAVFRDRPGEGADRRP